MVEILVVWATWRLDNGSNGEHPTGWFYRAAFDPNWREEGDAVRSSARKVRKIGISGYGRETAW